MTEKLYEKNSYLRECKAVVTECIKEEEGIFIKLDRTIFFPEEGGQYSDTGIITSGDITAHILKGELTCAATEGDPDIRYLVDEEIAVGTEVKCTLDWDIRFSRMQNHSGEHIVSGLIHNLYGYNNIGFHLSDDEPVTLVCDGKLTEDQVRMLEIKANEAIYADLPIIDSYPAKEDLKELSYRSKIEVAGQVRLITIGSADDALDVCACCAPHVSRTGAIGIIKILSFSGIKEGTQLQILCGKRALEFIEKNMDSLDMLARMFSTHRDNVPGLVEGLRDENQDLKRKLALSLERSILDEIKSSATDEDHTGCIFTDMDLSPVSMKNIFNELAAARKGYVGVFVGTDDEGYRYYAGGNGTDARKLAAEMREKLGAKGGGSPEMIQGKVSASKSCIEDFWRS
ncbi:MAG: alanyl-tRNA editing protein, partial [Lachnospiraceae bacterium]|nr:alanyl-tRNA editing protein [Lachnospiraceae bacterium]